MLDSGTVEWVEGLRQKYGVPGLAIGVLCGREGASCSVIDWEREFHTFGTRNANGDAYDKEVCLLNLTRY